MNPSPQQLVGHVTITYCISRPSSCWELGHLPGTTESMVPPTPPYKHCLYSFFLCCFWSRFRQYPLSFFGSGERRPSTSWSVFIVKEKGERRGSAFSPKHTASPQHAAWIHRSLAFFPRGGLWAGLSRCDVDGPGSKFGSSSDAFRAGLEQNKSLWGESWSIGTLQSLYVHKRLYYTH